MPMKTQWWYDDATYHYSGNSELVLARLTIRDDGTAELLIGEREVLEFENEDEASCWLVSEEYEPLASLLEDLAERNVPLDPRIKVPTATSQEELRRQMVIMLEPGDKMLSGCLPDSRPIPTKHGSTNSRSATE
jgi:hypothetical protein